MATRSWILALDPTDSELEASLVKEGYKIDRKYSENIADLENNLARAKGILVRSRVRLNKAILGKAVNLKWIGRLGAGLENIDVNFALKNGISCLNAAEGNQNSLAEHTLGILLNLAHRISLSNSEVRSGKWRRKENIGWEIKGSTIGIIGFGPMGASFASILQSMGVNIIAHDKYLKDFSPSYVQEVDLQTLQSQSDIISIHLPLSQENINFINGPFLDKCKKLKILLNTSRGKILNTKDALNNLLENKINALCLDVIDLESNSLELERNDLHSYNELINHPRVILTPHIGGWSQQSFPRMGSVLLKKIREVDSLM